MDATCVESCWLVCHHVIYNEFAVPRHTHVDGGRAMDVLLHNAAVQATATYPPIPVKTFGWTVGQTCNPKGTREYIQYKCGASLQLMRALGNAHGYELGVHFVHFSLFPPLLHCYKGSV